MKINPMSTSTFRATFLGIAFSLPLLGTAAVLTDPTLTSGANAIDPAGGRAITHTASGSTPEATLEGISGFSGIHDFTGFEDRTDSLSGNIISFSDASLPDIRFTSTGGDPGFTGYDAGNNGGYVISSGSVVILRENSSSGALTYSIEFGDYTGSTFTPNLNAVEAAGFVISNATSGQSYTVDFRNTSGSSLSQQTFAPVNGNNIYFGYQAVGATSVANDGIARIDILIDNSGTSSAFIGFDDLGFSPAVIPEPSTLALLGLSGVALYVAGRRRKR
jgi:hypothetical protein